MAKKIWCVFYAQQCRKELALNEQLSSMWSKPSFL